MSNKPNLTFQNGAPYCERFDDIYFDSKEGYAQSETVFINGNRLSERFTNLGGPFTIAETGFGTGLNFLLTIKAFLISVSQTKRQKIEEAKGSGSAILHFISTEKYPLSRQQLTQSLALFPEFSDLTTELLTQYPEDPAEADLAQFQATLCQGSVKLTLLFGDAATCFSKLKCPKEGLVDAWFLDGFSPRKNPDMWSDALFFQLTRLSIEQATLATFTIAGFVRRQLITAGFRLKKKQMNGHKKEMLSAVFQQSPITKRGYQLRPRITKPQHVAIIGGGVASACAAYLLTRQGVKVTLYCKDSAVAQGASSNAIGALFPLLHQQKDDISNFYEQAFWRAKTLYASLIEQGFNFAHQWCGLLDIAYKPALQKRQAIFEKDKAWPTELIHGVNAEQASTLANVSLTFGGLFMPNAGWIAPQDLVKQLFSAATSTNRLRIEPNCQIRKLCQQSDRSWILHSDRKIFKESVVVVCTGADTIKIDALNDLPLSSVRGQITSMATKAPINKLATVLCHKGYLTPENKGIHCIGATFDKDSFDIERREQDDQFNLSMLEKCLPSLVSWQTHDIVSAKARLRCMTPDHLPMVGAVPNIEAHIEDYAHLRKDKNWTFKKPATTIDNLYVMTGLGARGLCSAPLIADILCADICGTPYPVDNKTLFNLSPNRFVIRDLIKRKI